MQPSNFEDALDRITARDARYHREAYLFLREALDHTQKHIAKGTRPEPRHVSGKELLTGVKDYALAQFGPMAKTVLEAWGVHSCEDFGEIVFNMIEDGLLSKTESDSREDFKDGFEFDEVFCKPYRPKAQQWLRVPPESKAGQT